MAARLHNPAGSNNADPVSIHYRGEAMGDDQSSAIGLFPSGISGRLASGKDIWDAVL